MGVVPVTEPVLSDVVSPSFVALGEDLEYLVHTTGDGLVPEFGRPFTACGGEFSDEQLGPFSFVAGTDDVGRDLFAINTANGGQLHILKLDPEVLQPPPDAEAEAAAE